MALLLVGNADEPRATGEILLSPVVKGNIRRRMELLDAGRTT